MHTRTRSLSRRLPALGLATAGSLALLGGCAAQATNANAGALSQLQPGPTIAVADAVGAKVYAPTPRLIAARRAASSAYAAVQNQAQD